MEQHINFLLKIDLFKDVSFKELKKLFSEESYNIKSYKKNTVIYLQNEKCSTFDIILKGAICIQGINLNGNTLSVTTFTTGDCIGGNLLFSKEGLYPMTVLAKTDSSILKLKKEFILKLCQINLSFLNNFLASISTKNLILADTIKTLSYKSIRECIIDFVRYESYAQKSNKIKLDLTKKELAEKFGVQRTSLSRELCKMKNEGLIDYDTKTITLKQVEVT